MRSLLIVWCLLGHLSAEDLPSEEPEVVEEGDMVELVIPLQPKPAVQFSCARAATPEEDALEKALAGGNLVERGDALARLLALPAPHSVPEQHAAWRTLADQLPTHRVLAAAAEAFDPVRIRRLIAQAPPGSEYGSLEPSYAWAILAVGALGLEDQLPRLLALSASTNLDTTLAAGRAVALIPGEAADRALAEIVRIWRYDASHRAAQALVERDNGLLTGTLLAMSPVSDRRYAWIRLLGTTGDARVVPALCAIVPELEEIELEAFSVIARLATFEHRDLVGALPDRAPAAYREEAMACVHRWSERMVDETR